MRRSQSVLVVVVLVVVVFFIIFVILAIVVVLVVIVIAVGVEGLKGKFDAIGGKQRVVVGEEGVLEAFSAATTAGESSSPVAAASRCASKAAMSRLSADRGSFVMWGHTTGSPPPGAQVGSNAWGGRWAVITRPARLPAPCG